MTDRRCLEPSCQRLFSPHQDSRKYCSMACYHKPKIAHADRFWPKVEKDGPTIAHMATPCWVWAGNRNQKTGYGMTSRGRRAVPAHRVAYELTHGEVPTGLHVLHRCDNPPCVNPDHLYAGTHADNMRDVSERGRWGHSPKDGEHNGRARLTEVQVNEIRARLAAGAGQSALAREYGVSPSAVRMIQIGRTWVARPGKHDSEGAPPQSLKVNP